MPTHAARWLPGPYEIPDYHCQVYFVVTNKNGVGTYRAPGSTESCFVRERMLDMVAADLNLDPADLRRKNLIQPSEMPYDTKAEDQAEAPMVYDSGDYPSAFNQALEKIDYDKIKALQGKEEAGKYHGIGIATFVKLSGLGPFERARVVVRGARDVRVYLGIATLGQGHETTMAQICADALGVPMDIIRVFHGNTDFVSDGIGTFGGRATVMGGSALYMASQALRSKILSIASNYLEVAESDLELRDGRVFHRDGGKEVPKLDLDEVVNLARQTDHFDPQESGLVEEASFESNKNAYPYGTHAAHITVDPDTGKIEILRYVTVHDVGRCVNPLLIQGQIVGAVVQGIGGALMEDLVYDENGQLLTTTFMDYLLPTSTDTPPIESIVLEEAPSPNNPLGVKGAGELGIVGPGAALANAVCNALSSMGVQVRELPLSPDKLRALIRQSQGR